MRKAIQSWMTIIGTVILAAWSLNCTSHPSTATDVPKTPDHDEMILWPTTSPSVTTDVPKTPDHHEIRILQSTPRDRVLIALGENLEWARNEIRFCKEYSAALRRQGKKLDNLSLRKSYSACAVLIYYDESFLREAHQAILHGEQKGPDMLIVAMQKFWTYVSKAKDLNMAEVSLAKSFPDMIIEKANGNRSRTWQDIEELLQTARALMEQLVASNTGA